MKAPIGWTGPSYFVNPEPLPPSTWIGNDEYGGGWWQISESLHFAIREKPNAWQRFWHRHLLGWRWVESQQ